MIEDITASLARFGIHSLSREEETLRLLIDLGVQVADADTGALLLRDPDRGDLLFAMAAGEPETARALVGQRVPMGAGLTGLAAVTRETQMGEPTYFGVRQAGRHGGEGGSPTFLLAAPMLIDDDLIGVITAATFQAGRRFGAREATLFSRIAAVAALVLHQRRQIVEWQTAQSGPVTAGSVSEQQRLERELVGAALGLARAHPRQLASLMWLLSAVDGLLDRNG